MLHKASIIHYFKNYGSLTLQTKFKVELNMGDLTSFFETVRTLKIRQTYEIPDLLISSIITYPFSSSIDYAIVALRNVSPSCTRDGARNLSFVASQ